MKEWERILRERVGQSSKSRVARELGVSPSTVTQVMKGTYGADTAKFGRRVMAVYGGGGTVACPVQGEITPIACADTFRRARAIGLNVGNAATFRQHSMCLKCPVRND